MIAYIRISNNDDVDIKITDITEIKVGTINALFNEYKSIIFIRNDEYIIYPIKNILKISIEKGDL